MNIGEFIKSLPGRSDLHAPSTEFYINSKSAVRKEIEGLFSDDSQTAKDLPPFGKISFPYHKMGAVDSLNLFDMDELIIFSFYWLNREKYKRAADIGANIGLHSIIMDRCGFEVHAYEPDPEHFKVLKQNLELNGCSNVFPHNAAVSTRGGMAEFTRVLGNTTGSHLSGAKANPLGELERFSVAIEPIGPIIERADLLKIDAEGHEKEILLATNKEEWVNTDAIVEVGNEENAKSILEHFSQMGVNLFAQKINWHKVESLEDMPKSYRDGSLFITSDDRMPW